MVLGEITARQTRTVGGFNPIDYPLIEARPWDQGREDTLQLESAPLLPWVAAVSRRLIELSKRQANWDPRGSRPLNISDTKDALMFLASVMSVDSPVPGITLLLSGGLELHWSVGDTDLEVIFDSAEGERVALLDHGDEDYELTPEEAASCADFLGSGQAVAV